jgi:predicted Zn-dependent protease
MELSFHVIHSDTTNAFTTLGGYVFVSSALFTVLDNENALAMVLAHEIAHAIGRDPLLGTGRGMLVGLLFNALSGGQVSAGGLNVETLGDLGSELMLTAYSREQEQRADLMALRALQAKYGHVGGATDLFEALAGTMQDEAGNKPRSEVLHTHPDLERRIDYLRREAQRHGWTYQSTLPYPQRIGERVMSS